MRIARNNIRRGVEGAREEWEKQMASLKKKMFVKLNKKQASPTDAQLAFFKPIYADRDFFDLPIIYNKGILLAVDVLLHLVGVGNNQIVAHRVDSLAKISEYEFSLKYPHFPSL